MINKITLKNIASYRNEAVLETDKKVNLIYGLNGTGKSTFSSYLYDLSDPQYADCNVLGLNTTDRLLVYNQQFIKDNFYETEDIHGIFTLSKENKEVKKIIDEANKTIQTLNDSKRKIDKAKEEIDSKYEKQIDNYQKTAWKIKTDYTGGDRVLEFCLNKLKGNRGSLFNYLVNIKYDDKQIVYSIEDLKKEAADLQGDFRKEALIARVQFSTSILENSPLLKKVIVGNRDSSVASLINQLKNSDWVNEGLQYVHLDVENAPCPFCQQKTVSKVLLAQITAYFDDSYKLDKMGLESLLDQYKSKTEKELAYINEIKDNRFLEDETALIEDTLNKISKIIDINIRVLQEKIKKPSEIVSMESLTEYAKNLNEIIEKANNKIESYNKKIEHVQDSLDTIKEKFWNLMRKEYDSVVNLYLLADKEYKKACIEYKKNIDQNKKDIEVQEDIVVENQKKTINIDVAVNNIKQGLMDIGITDFTIEKNSVEDALYHLKRENITGNVFPTLSEGEKMVISFLYFLELCKGEKMATASAANKIVVIDDPISSLSHIYVFNIGRLIHNEFLRTNNYAQIFVLTHSLYFFYELTNTNHAERKETQNLFRLCKNNGGSLFVKMKYEEIQNDYQAYWHIVKDKDQSPALIANCMRNIMEYFFNFVEKQDFANIFQREELSGTRFLAFNRYMNRESHSKGQNIFDIKEFDYDSFKDAFKLVFEIEGYLEHYKKMMS